jgi:GNAT superfamily N-acetyltransferase
MLTFAQRARKTPGALVRPSDACYTGDDATRHNIIMDHQGQTAFLARDGREVRVRQEQAGDAGHLVHLFQHLGPASRYYRFSKDATSADPAAVQQRAEELARQGPPHDMAWLAFADLPEEPDAAVAAARYVRLDGEEGVGELAISVRDDMQRQGIGGQMLRFLLEQARADGMRRLVANFQATNQGVWGLLRHSPYRVTTTLDGSMVRAEVDLTQPIGDSSPTAATLDG